ncbi:CHASE domain-containing protein [Novosphingobium sp. YJ-S2-02]|uniref:histidine kinase n=1 Tax=Novosphingobium aureum TaxID=2792964 RepID=A0A931HAE0_9SPHN|nr:CHASE domain-containing protein [Novosphingobium aureum]MBH0112306.1 CHASE domain-containing protein [Novosphingobium aureum]
MVVDQPLLDRVEKQAWFHKYPRGWPFLLFVIASVTTAVSVMAIERADREARHVALASNMTEMASALQRRITENIAVLRAASALFATRSEVTPQQFSEFVGDMQGEGNLYGSLGIGWAPLVPASGLARFEVDQLEKGNVDVDFVVRPRPGGQRRVTTPIVYLAPLTNMNQRAIAYDMYSEPVRRAAMDKALALGRPIATGKVHLVQNVGEPDRAGFLIYMPVVTETNGRKRAKGFIYSPFQADTFLTSAAELYRNDNLELAIYDDKVAPENLLAQRLVDGTGGLILQRRLDVAGHTWVLQVRDRKGGSLSALSRITLFFGAIASLMVMAIGRLITKRAAEDRQVLEWLSSQASIRDSLTRELNHRVKNTLANVLSIAALTRRRSKDIDDFTQSLTARIRALSATHDLLSQSDWGFAALGDVVRSELAPYMEGNESHVEMTGPDIKLAPNDAMSLGLAIHELATNAAKYGALSTVGGRIHVNWQLLSHDLAEIDWREEGGPPVVEPSKRGFGRDLIEKIVAHELKSEVDLRFKPEGVECRLMVPVRNAREFALRAQKRRALTEATEPA